MILPWLRKPWYHERGPPKTTKSVPFKISAVLDYLHNLTVDNTARSRLGAKWTAETEAWLASDAHGPGLSQAYVSTLRGLARNLTPRLDGVPDPRRVPWGLGTRRSGPEAAPSHPAATCSGGGWTARLGAWGRPWAPLGLRSGRTARSGLGRLGYLGVHGLLHVVDLGLGRSDSCQGWIGGRQL